MQVFCACVACVGIGRFMDMCGCSVFGTEAAPKKSALRFCVVWVVIDAAGAFCAGARSAVFCGCVACAGELGASRAWMMQRNLARLPRCKKARRVSVRARDECGGSALRRSAEHGFSVPVSPMRRKIGVSSKIHRIRIRQCEARRLQAPTTHSRRPLPCLLPAFQRKRRSNMGDRSIPRRVRERILPC